MTDKQKEAIERNEAWAQLTPEQQIADLDRRLGKGVGAIKSRAKLKYIIEHPQVENQKKGKSRKSKKAKNVKNS